MAARNFRRISARQRQEALRPGPVRRWLAYLSGTLAAASLVEASFGLLAIVALSIDGAEGDLALSIGWVVVIISAVVAMVMWGFAQLLAEPIKVMTPRIVWIGIAALAAVYGAAVLTGGTIAVLVVGPMVVLIAGRVWPGELP